MPVTILKEHIKDVDIYILDQILKDRYQKGAKILEAGCGNGRNLKWFYKPEYEIFGTDLNIERIKSCQKLYNKQQDNFMEASAEQMPFDSKSFDHVICIAVLHFANNLNQFLKMFNELLRILKPQGSLLIRTATNIGIENKVEFIKDGVYKLPDGSTRFLVDAEILDKIQSRNDIALLENVKTTIVQNKRAMLTLVIKKVT